MMLITGKPLEWPILIQALPKDFTPDVKLLPGLFAASITVFALTWVRRTLSSGRSMQNWIMGISLCWALICTLLLPWVDHAKSYRSVFAAMEIALPNHFNCIASKNLGESERAMLSYFSGIITHRKETKPFAQCDLLLVNGLHKSQPKKLLKSKEWRLIWEGACPGDNRERLWLFAAKKRSLDRALEHTHWGR